MKFANISIKEQGTYQTVSILEKLNHNATEHIQTLWSGYGSIKRVMVDDEQGHSAIIKHVQLPSERSHPRGWNTSLSHQRKIRSYQVESAWYKSFAHQCDSTCRVPQCMELQSSDTEFLMVLEDLDAVGYRVRHTTLEPRNMLVCLRWLASFHATFMSGSYEQALLWTVGTYWHLDTRPDEYDAMPESALKQAARDIDQRLSAARYQTLVHGDAKLANFCFSADAQSVAAVDFQYVGGGVGIKDVAYFIGSCLHEEDCELYEDFLLDHYFDSLKQSLELKWPDIDASDVESEWRALYALACADFHRFILGWNPGHWKINDYSERKVQKALSGLADST